MVDYIYTLPNSTTGIDSIIGQTMNSGGSMASFIPGSILFFIFLVVFIGGSTRQKTRTGTADYSAWAVVGSVATFFVALLMSISAEYIQLDWLLIVVTLTIGSVTWFFLDRKTSEV